MSGIAGIYNFDGKPVDRVLLERMTSAIAHRGPDGIHHWIDGPVGMGHCMLQTTLESVYERQPLSDESGNLCLTMDGRVDNREELVTALQSRGASLRDNTDAEIVLKAYECWGTECPSRIIGDFSFAIWDKRQRQLFCARDVVGNKPFVYHWNGRRLLFSSELHALFEDAATPVEPNEGMIGEYLAVNIIHTEETLYKDILRLPPAHYMIVKNGHATKHRYWDIDFSKEIRYGSDREYAEHFTEVFKECVRCCLRSHRPVGAYLSGGLDSSSVVSMAQRVYREGLVEDRGFETFSMVYPGLPCDETPYIRALVERWNLHANYMPSEKEPLDRQRKQISLYKDICDYPNGTDTDPLRALAREKGVRVLLTGHGGDERVSGSLYYLADFVRDRKLLALYREMHRQEIPIVSKKGLSTLVHYALVPLFPEVVRKIVRSVKRALAEQRESLNWIDAEFARRIRLEERVRDDRTAGQPLRCAKMWLLAQLEHGGQIHGMELEDRTAAWFGVEQRHPFMDRRMIELSFALPENQRLRRDQKYVLRHAMRGLLPELVCHRRDKAEFSETLFRAIGHASAGTLCKPRSEELGWINGSRVRAMRKEMYQLHNIGDEGYILLVWPLWMVCVLDLWLDELLSRRNSAWSRQQADLEPATA
jgi:asparagine synthase (glutamine-hydrolysing)